MEERSERAEGRQGDGERGRVRQAAARVPGAAGPAWQTDLTAAWAMVEGWLGGALPGILRSWPLVFRRQLFGDCCQEARLLLWGQRGRLFEMPEDEWRAYAYRCVQRCVARVVRREYAVQCRSAPFDDSVDSKRPGTSGLEWSMLRAELLEDEIGSEDVASALRALSPPERFLMDLYYLHGLTSPQIAALTGGSDAYVRVRHQRALDHLRKRLKESAVGASGDA